MFSLSFRVPAIQFDLLLKLRRSATATAYRLALCAIFPVLSSGAYSAEPTYRLVVNLGGVLLDNGASSRLSEFISKYEVQTSQRIERTYMNWGMEGEATMCFPLSELSAHAQEKFVNDVRVALSTGGFQIEENAPCEGHCCVPLTGLSKRPMAPASTAVNPVK